MIASRVAVLALVVGTAAASCSLLPGTVSEDACPAVLTLELVGALISEADEEVTLVPRDGRELEPVWPRSFTERATEDGIEIHGPTREVVATAGDLVDLNAWIDGDKLRICDIKPHDPSLLESASTGRLSTGPSYRTAAATSSAPAWSNPDP